jgi:intracellular septation protein
LKEVGPSDAAAAEGDGGTGLIKHILARRIAVEAGPLIAFFASFYLYGILAATAVFMAATAVAVAASLWAEGRWPILPFISLALVLAFGGLTLWTDDPLFIMIRPTVVNGLYGLALLGSLPFERPLLEKLLSPGLLLDRDGWRKLTLRLGAFFILQAVLNEIAWRGFGVEAWVFFKTFGTIPLNIVFALSQLPLVKVHRLSARPQFVIG